MQQPAKNNFITILFTFFYIVFTVKIFTEILNILKKKQLSEMQNGPLPIWQLQNADSETFGLKKVLKINVRVFNNRASVFIFTFYLSAEAANTNGNMDQHHLMDHKSFSKLNQKLNALHSHRHTTLSLRLINTI